MGLLLSAETGLVNMAVEGQAGFGGAGGDVRPKKEVVGRGQEEQSETKLGGGPCLAGVNQNTDVNQSLAASQQLDKTHRPANFRRQCPGCRVQRPTVGTRWHAHQNLQPEGF